MKGLFFVIGMATSAAIILFVLKSDIKKFTWIDYGLVMTAAASAGVTIGVGTTRGLIRD